MRFAVIAFNNIKFSPYVKTYTKILDEKQVAYDIIYPDRENMNEDLGTTVYSVKWEKSKNKLINFLKFRKEAQKILRKNKYDFVFVLTTFPAVLLSSFLSRRYKGKYLVDIRDHTHENNRLYFALEKKVLKNAALNVISSPGFTNFLPKGDYILCHNMSEAYQTAPPRGEFTRSTDKITIGYVGTIAYAAYCKQLIDLVKNDERFCLRFYGNEKGTMPVTTYVEALNNDRVQCFGAYDPSEKDKIIDSVDILFNAYGNATPLVKYALSNKLYDSFYFKKPLLTSSGTSMSTLAGDYSFDLDSCHGNLNDLYKWYHAIDEKAMIPYMDTKISQYIEEMRAFKQKIENITSKE